MIEKTSRCFDRAAVDRNLVQVFNRVITHYFSLARVIGEPEKELIHDQVQFVPNRTGVKCLCASGWRPVFFPVHVLRPRAFHFQPNDFANDESTTCLTLTLSWLSDVSNKSLFRIPMSV